jgi:predicted dehydrogenase
MVIRIGIIGTGNIFPAYLNTLRKQRRVRIVGIADAQPAVAQARAAEFGLTAMTVDELLASPAQIVLNITPPAAHHEIGMAVLNAGKHLFNEKPLAATFAQGRELVALAAERNLRLGCAPDTVLGAGSQAVRALVDAGAVGRIVSGSAQFMNHGPDHWHPNPDFFYRHGAGSLHDMGPYYISHLVHHLGPVAELHATARMTWRERIIPRGVNAGRSIKVEVPTTVVSHLRFAAGAEVSLTVSFDVWKHGHTPIELYGEHGTILGHDPNRFGGKVRWSQQDGDWQTVRERRPYATNSRGIGLLDMAFAIENGRPHRCSEAFALHVLEVMDKSLESAALGRAIPLATTCERPAALSARLT